MADDAILASHTVSVGTRLPPLDLPPVDRTTLALFAGASGDHNPAHIDIEAARRSGMPDVLAHGMLSMAYLARLLTRWMPQSRLRRFSVRFVAITHLGNELRCGGRVTAIENIGGERCARVDLSATTNSARSRRWVKRLSPSNPGCLCEPARQKGRAGHGRRPGHRA